MQSVAAAGNGSVLSEIFRYRYSATCATGGVCNRPERLSIPLPCLRGRAGVGPGNLIERWIS